MKQSHFTLIAVLLMAVAFITVALLNNSGEQQQSQVERMPDINETLIKAHSVRAGNPAAKVTIVEFMDPACGTCARFHPFVKRLMKQNTGKINLVVRYLPFHKGSDQMVAILEAARKQDKFWEVLELMFATQKQWTVNHVAQPEVFWGFIDEVEVDKARIEQDMKDPTIAKIIQQDLADGRQLGADKTPTFFVNGKPLPSFGFEQLQTLVESEVRANY